MKINAVIDRIEGKRAVLFLGDETESITFPRAYLPSGAKEGDHLTVTIAIDAQRTQEAKAEAEDLLAQILKNNT